MLPITPASRQPAQEASRRQWRRALVIDALADAVFLIKGLAKDRTIPRVAAQAFTNAAGLIVDLLGAQRTYRIARGLAQEREAKFSHAAARVDEIKRHQSREVPA